MNIIPIVFSFDDNLVLPAGVCISSLLEHANENTFYDIFILHDEVATYPTSGFFSKLKNRFTNFNITFKNIGNPFPDAYEIRGITIPAYYRLLIPDFIFEYDKVMYHDVDVIFRFDMSEIYYATDISNHYIGGVLSGSESLETYNYRTNLGLDSQKYINSGNLIFNCKKLREDNIVDFFKKEIVKNYHCQDQDIINIVCSDRILFLPAYFSGTNDMFRHATLGKETIYNKIELDQLLLDGNIHYNGPKPWVDFCLNFDVWWEYYRKSIFFDQEFYYNFYKNKLHHLDSLPLWKRLKLVARFFKTGGKIK